MIRNSEIARLRNIIAPKDVEIERLKAEFQKAKEWNKLTELEIRNLRSVVEDQDKLITELADALVSAEKDFVWYNEGDDLIQRAREACK